MQVNHNLSCLVVIGRASRPSSCWKAKFQSITESRLVFSSRAHFHTRCKFSRRSAPVLCVCFQTRTISCLMICPFVVIIVHFLTFTLLFFNFDKNTLGPFIRGKIRHVLRKTRLSKTRTVPFIRACLVSNETTRIN